MQLSPATSETPPVTVLGHMTLNVMMLAVSLTVNQVGKKNISIPRITKQLVCVSRTKFFRCTNINSREVNELT